jgi:hypothetical protein
MSLFIVVNACQISLIAIATYGQTLVASLFARFARGADSERFVHRDLAFIFIVSFRLI